MRSHKSIIIAATVLATACSEVAQVRAEIITQTVEFVTPSTGSQNQLAVTGILNTLSQGLGIVDFGNTSVNVSGLLRAQLTLNIPESGELEILDFEFLDSSFTQSGVSLFYDVPNTSRRVTFSATDLQFGMQLTGQNSNTQQLLATASSFPGNSFQIVQNSGTAQVSITNRPSVSQNLSQLSVLSTYQGNEPTGQTSFTILPPPDGSEEPLIQLNLPLSNHQLHYARVRLPVTLNYSGTLSLIAPLPLVGNQVPEPGSLLLLGGGVIVFYCCGRRSR